MKYVKGKDCSISAGKNCIISDSVRFFSEVIMGDNCVIEDDVVLGYGNLTRLREGYTKSTKIILGNNVHIRSGTIIYVGCKIGNFVHIGHNVVLREFTEVGDHTSIGTSVVCEGYTKIGHHTNIQSQCNITAKTKIGNYVFFGPKVTTANDRKIRYYRPNVSLPEQGPTVDDGAIIGAGVCLLPYVHVKMGAFVAMASVVTKDVEKFTLVMGAPARKVRHVNDDEVTDVPEIRNEYIRFIGKIYEMDEEY